MRTFEYWHRTSIGTFVVEPSSRAGIYGWDLLVDGHFIEFFLHAWMAAAALARGDLDGKLGVITKDLAIPLQLSEWNGDPTMPRRVSL